MPLKDQTTGNRKGFIDRLRYVEDFRVETFEDEKGRVHRKAVYTGTWNVFRDTGKATFAKLAGSAALAVLAAVLGIMILVLTHGLADSYPVVVPFMLLLFPALYLLMGATSLPYKRKPMRRDQYMHGMVRMQRSSVAVTACAAVGLLASLIVRAVRSDWFFLKEDVLFLVYGLVIVSCAAGILALLGSIELYELPNEAHRE